MLSIVEIDADDRIAAVVVFDPDDIDAAFEELDARYLAGEAAAARAHVVGHRRSTPRSTGTNFPPTTPDWVNIDHRRVAAFEPGDLTAYIRAAWDLAPDVTIYIEAVHRLSDLGAVVTHAAHGTSQEGFDAEWRMIELLTVDGDLINRCEIFDEADLDAALASSTSSAGRRRGWKTRQAECTSASRRTSRPATGTRMAEMLADDISTDDRRRVVNGGVRRGRDAADREHARPSPMSGSRS